MAWPPTTHQDVQDAVTARAVIGDVGTSGTPTGDALRAAFVAPTIQSKQTLETVEATALRRFRADLANREVARCNMLHVGDSITWGYRETSGGNTLSLARRWPSVLRDTMRQRFPTAGSTVGGFGFMAPRQVFGSSTTFIDATVTNTGGSDDPGYGLTRDAWVIAAGNTQVYTFTGTGADLSYVTYGGGGTFSWRVDSGAATNVSTAGTLTDLNLVQIRNLTAGAHTVTLTGVSGSSFLTGLFAMNGDESTGIGSWVAAWPGVSSGYWSANSNWINNLPWATPSLVTLTLGANDAGSSTAWASPATFKTNMQTIIANIKATLGYSPSFVLTPVWTIAPYSANPAAWSDYVQVHYDIAAADPDGAVCVFDLYRRVNPGAVGANTAGLLDSADNLHPSQPRGARFIAESLASFIGPR